MFLISSNLAKYSYGWSPLEQHHKIGNITLLQPILRISQFGVFFLWNVLNLGPMLNCILTWKACWPTSLWVWLRIVSLAKALSIILLESPWRKFGKHFDGTLWYWIFGWKHIRQFLSRCHTCNLSCISLKFKYEMLIFLLKYQKMDSHI
jgi:hypothetical protein